MATLEEITEGVKSFQNSISEIDSKLDVVKERILALEAGSVTQEQLTELAALVDSAKTHASSVSAEAAALVSTPEPAPEGGEGQSGESNDGQPAS